MNQGKVEQIGSPQEIFEKPASQFVFDFLGNVNVFEGHISRGQASVGSFSVDYPHYTEDQTRPAMLYVRPHEFDIDKSSNGTSSFRAVVVRAHPVGSLARVRLVSLDFETPFDAEIHIERFMELSLKAGDTVYVAPKRVRVFTAESNVPDYSI
jgi:sulfate transport system ATP-binding protein